MARDLDPRRAEWIEIMVRGISEEISKTARGRSGEEFSVFMVPVIQAIWKTQGREQGRFGGHAFPLGQKADELMIGWRVLRRYLKALSQAGLIKCVSWYDDRLKQRFPLEVILSPDFLEACGATRLGDARAYGRALGMTWLERRNTDSIQGFGDDDRAPWGRFAEGEAQVQTATRPGLVAVSRETPRSELVAKVKAAAKGRKVAESQKREAREKRLKLEAAFIQGAATVWVTMRARAGYGTEAPAWAGNRMTLAPSARDARNELAKQFAAFGGKKAAVAWALFCGAKPEFDSKSRRVYNPDLAFQQNAGSDKKPKVFSNNINQVLDYASTFDVARDPAFLKRLADAFGESFEAEPGLPTIQPRQKEEADHGDQAATGTEGGGDSGVHQRQAVELPS